MIQTVSFSPLLPLLIDTRADDATEMQRLVALVAVRFDGGASARKCRYENMAGTLNPCISKTWPSTRWAER